MGSPSKSPVSRRRGGARRPQDPNSLAAAHARFARAALTIYLAAAAVAVSLLVATMVTDKDHDEDQAREKILVRTDVRAHSLGQHLGLLMEELRRLSLRSEVDLSDKDLSPEKSLLQLSHERSTFFNLGVAILDTRGEVVWSEPRDFAHGSSFGSERWFAGVRQTRALHLVPVAPDRPDAVLYVVSPLVKNREFTGALLGAIDLARGEPLAGQPVDQVLTVLATREGAVIYPPVPPPFAAEPRWRSIFGSVGSEPFTEDAVLAGKNSLVAVSPVSGTDLVLLTVADRDRVLLPAFRRLEARLAVTLGLATVPLVALVLLLRRSLKLFRKNEEQAVREERLRMLGEAANSIAHEVKNGLNGVSMGLDLVVRRDERPGSAERRERVLVELRREIQRLSEFTSELMTFSKGVAPRLAEIDLADFVPKVTGLLRDSAAELGVELALEVPEVPVPIEADPTLLHSVISNLVSNALDAVAGGRGDAAPHVEVRLDARGHTAELRVTDNGPGVSEGIRPHLFEPFHTDKPNGVGIGLALARKIARAHEGDLVLERNAPGACFLLTLPLESV